ncbi:hypothetical protein ATPR_1127 [Acetobacter tropicalis NBRC 101654]|uniref:Uncharacterized protein n=1 Tax=Acetobacter tropicalis NBRC 101654 TaxID=749388 RepID=F7VCM9_9PROT|nr:hypothetical protein ATPR_1127 [Acetobacter tropicalis NBRC 101654]
MVASSACAMLNEAVSITPPASVIPQMTEHALCLESLLLRLRYMI